MLLAQRHLAGLVPLAESCEQARGLLAKYAKEIEHAKRFPSDEGVLDHEDGIEFFLKKFPNAQLQEFRGHGVSKGSEMEILGGFINILANQTIKGDIGRLQQGDRSTFIPAYTRSPFLVVSHYGRELVDLHQNNHPKFNAVGLKVDVGAHVINCGYYPLLDELRSMFPERTIMRANELPAYISSEIEIHS